MSSYQRLVNRVLDCDVLVVGGGAAGCFAAIKAAEAGARVWLVDKARIGRSGCSPFAAGSINLCLPEDDREAWFAEIVTRGEYLNDQEWVRVQLAEAFPLARELQTWGRGYGLKILEEDEQGHLVRRRARGNIQTLTSIIYALPMMDTLRRRAREAGVELLERVMVTHLVSSGGRVIGAVGLGTRDARIYLFRAPAVVLAAGGCGFKAFFIGHQNLTGEAQFMAFRAGAVLRNLDQAMSNTTAREFDIHGLSLMVGCGGRFVNGRSEEFMWRYDPELGNRARLTRLVIGMAREVQAGRGPIYFDLSQVSAADREMLRRVLPEGFRAFARLGLDPFREKIEWMPAFEGTLVHGGGIHIDTDCATTVPGLYACGDATCTPVHGTWSITGLNLAFCFVSGARAGRAAARWAGNHGSHEGWHAPEVVPQVEEAVAELLQPVWKRGEIDPDEVVRRLQEILIPYEVCYLRREERLQKALEELRGLYDLLPLVGARDPHGLVKAFEVKSMVAISEMVLKSVLFRRESRGFLYREDHPYTDNVHWLKWITVQRGPDGRPLVDARDFPTPYLEPPRTISPWEV